MSQTGPKRRLAAYCITVNMQVCVF